MSFDLQTVLQPVPDWLSLNPDLDPEPARERFARAGRVHIPDFLAPDAAERIYLGLAGADALWARSTIVRGEVRELDLAWLAALPPEEKAAMRLDRTLRARKGFQFDFDNFRLSDAVLAGARFGRDYEPVFDFLNGPEFLAFARRLTGDDRIAYVDAQTTRYRAGQFLTLHDDDKPGHDRLYAYVLGFTRDWRADWGGLLAFLDADGHVEQAWTPAFNALNVFRVPAPHVVTQVADYAGGDRLSITGWMRSAFRPTVEGA